MLRDHAKSMRISLSRESVWEPRATTPLRKTMMFQRSGIMFERFGEVFLDDLGGDILGRFSDGC